MGHVRATIPGIVEQKEKGGAGTAPIINVKRGMQLINRPKSLPSWLYSQKFPGNYMHKLLKLMLLIAVAGLAFSCLKSKSTTPCVNDTVAQDEPAILNYLSSNGITGYVKDPSGLYYKIEAQGSGPSPSISSSVYVRYNGTFTNKVSFDSLADESKSGWVLGTMLKGWQIGLPQIQKGGSILLVIPSALAYGCEKTGAIPGNSILVFNIQLIDVK
jgi:FKBP-type peptidyl-prolyl cis-trans isomerase FkpA